jgi:hypothetical protein
MKLRIEINMDNEAFGSTQYERTQEIGFCLLDAIARIKRNMDLDVNRFGGKEEVYIVDSNGNKVGFARVTTR